MEWSAGSTLHGPGSLVSGPPVILILALTGLASSLWVKYIHTCIIQSCRGGSGGGSWGSIEPKAPPPPQKKNNLQTKISCKPVLPLDLHTVSQNALEVLSGVPYFHNFPGGGGPDSPSPGRVSPTQIRPSAPFKVLDPPLTCIHNYMIHKWYINTYILYRYIHIYITVRYVWWIGFLMLSVGAMASCNYIPQIMINNVF